LARDYLSVADVLGMHTVLMQRYAEMMQLFESGTFDVAHLDPWLRSFAAPVE
jgi:hypothetical protein